MKNITIMDDTWKNIASTYVPFKVAAIKKRKRLTRQILQLQADWDDLKQSEFNQLDQYLQQKIFGKPSKILTWSQFASLTLDLYR